MDPSRVCEALVGLPEVTVLGVAEDGHGVRVVIESRVPRPRCVECESPAIGHGRREVELVDLACFGRPTRLVWRKQRWRCSESSCDGGTWTGENPRIGSPRLAMTDRASRWVTLQVGRHGRSVNEVAIDLRCVWHTVMDAVTAYGQVLIDDLGRFGDVEAIGLDETLMFRLGAWKRQQWSTQIVDVGRGQLLDVVRDRTAAAPAAWLAARSQ